MYILWIPQSWYVHCIQYQATSDLATIEIEETVAAVRTFSRFTSATVIVALVAITVLAVCCVVLGASATGGLMVADGACAISSHGSYARVGPSAESPQIAMALSATPGTQLLLGIIREIEVRDALDPAELPDSPDPRHGRIRA